MNNLLVKFIVYTLFFSMPSAFYQPADESRAVSAPIKNNSQSLGIEVSAKGALVLDKNSQAVLFERNSEAILPIASLTKLMTALVFLDTHPDWSRNYIMTSDDQRPGNITRLIPGEEINIKGLFNVMIIASSNEAAAAVARSSDMKPEEFVAAMNAKAKNLGMVNTKFVDPTGLDPGNVSTAYDVTILAEKAFSRYEIAAASILKNYEFKIINKNITRQINNTNQLLSSFINNDSTGYHIVGAKTGFLEESLYNLTTEINNGGNQIIITVLGCKTTEDRWQEVKGLAYWTYNNYTWPK